MEESDSQLLRKLMDVVNSHEANLPLHVSKCSRRKVGGACVIR